MNRETAIKNEILLELSRHPQALVWNSPCGTFRSMTDPSRVIRIGPPGRADLIGVIGGRAVAIEVKTSTGRLRVEQERWRDAFQARGGIWVLARSVDDALMGVGL